MRTAGALAFTASKNFSRAFLERKSRRPAPNCPSRRTTSKLSQGRSDVISSRSFNGRWRRQVQIIGNHRSGLWAKERVSPLTETPRHSSRKTQIQTTLNASASHPGGVWGLSKKYAIPAQVAEIEPSRAAHRDFEC